jgi:hypothetical protein
MMRRTPKTAFTVTTDPDIRIGLEEVRARRGRTTGVIPKLRDLYTEALKAFLAAEEPGAPTGTQKHL